MKISSSVVICRGRGRVVGRGLFGRSTDTLGGGVGVVLVVVMVMMFLGLITMVLILLLHQ